MGSPYLNSGEDIVLTTHRVIADAVPYDIMLTTERLFLIDNRSTRFEPRTLPLATILAVQGGKTPASEPVITLLFHPQGGMSRQPINLVFSQTPNENRKPERDDWVRNLIRLSLTRQEREVVPETPVLPEATRGPGLRPTARHGSAPDFVRPLSNVAIREKVPAPVTVIPEEIEDNGEMPAREAAVIPLVEEEPAPVPEEPAFEITTARGRPPAVSLPPARVIIPQIIEEMLPEKKMPSPMGEQEPEPTAVLDPEALFRTIPTAVRSMTVTEEQRPSQPRKPAMNPELASEIIAPAVPEHQEVPEIVKALRIGATEPVTPDVLPDADLPDSLPEFAPDPGERIGTVVPEQPVTSGPAGPEDIQAPFAEATEPVTPEMVPETETEDSLPELAPDLAEIIGTMVPEWPVIPASAGPEDIQAPLVEATEPVTPEVVPETGMEDSLPEPAPDLAERIGTMVPEWPVIPASAGPEIQEPVGNPAAEVEARLEPAVAEAPPIRHPIPPAREIRPLRTTLAYAALILFIVLVAAGALLLLPAEPGHTGVPETPALATVPITPSIPATAHPAAPASTPEPSVTTLTAPPIPSGTASPVPQDGVWIRVNSTSQYFGTLGNTGMMRQVSGTGDTFYKVLKNDQPVQVSVQKKDNSGAVLAVAIYRNGTLISTRSVNAPMGTVDVLINPVTARAPGLSENDVQPAQTAIRSGLEDY